ncbi:MAG TPA: tRNA (guanosine(37)-N1)-methyltransferase TrmD [Motilibacterales bacterium]|nr:tRNA (guanosine(37)-N1)-methyltransferase TrmD [Motilibacterales bacterium]
MRIDVVSIFGEYLAPLHLSLVGRAIADGLIDLAVHDLRDFTRDRHRTVDDSPYGGGPGMVMKPEPWGEALRSVLAAGDPGDPVRIVVPTPSGRPFTQAMAEQWSGDPRLVFACGRYEGIDSRVVAWARTLTAAGQPVAVEEVSIGDYVLAGAEAAVLVMVEALGRLIPGVLGNEASHADDSFATGGMERLLEGPIHTRPPVWEGLAVPEVLTSGDHGAVARWRHEQALARTQQMRPDLLG